MNNYYILTLFYLRHTHLNSTYRVCNRRQQSNLRQINVKATTKIQLQITAVANVHINNFTAISIMNNNDGNEQWTIQIKHSKESIKVDNQPLLYSRFN